MWQVIRGAVLASLVLAYAASVGSAQAYQVFTDRAAWEAALAGATITTDPFDNEIANADTITFDSGVVSTGVPASADFFNLVETGEFDGTVDEGVAPNLFDTITWTFPVPITGFGMDLRAAASSASLTLTGDFDGTGDQVISVFSVLGAPGTGFLGVIGAATFTTVVLGHESRGGNPTEDFFVDNLSFAAAPAAVPEPATLALFGAGLAGLGWIARRRKTS